MALRLLLSEYLQSSHEEVSATTGVSVTISTEGTAVPSSVSLSSGGNSILGLLSSVSDSFKKIIVNVLQRFKVKGCFVPNSPLGVTCTASRGVLVFLRFCKSLVSARLCSFSCFNIEIAYSNFTFCGACTFHRISQNEHTPRAPGVQQPFCICTASPKSYVMF